MPASRSRRRSPFDTGSSSLRARRPPRSEGPMAFLDRRSSIIVAVVAAALAWAVPPAARGQDAPRTDNPGQAASPPADAATGDMIRIEYVPPKDPKYQTA